MAEAFKEAGPLKVICRRSLRVNHGLPLNYGCREPPLLTWRPEPSRSAAVTMHTV